jgi:hypothetical protein
MAECIPFSTWTAAAREVSSLTLVWTVANAYLDSTRRIAAADLGFHSNLRRRNDANDANDAACRTTRPYSRHPVLGIARAGVEIQRGSKIAITFDPSLQCLDLKRVPTDSRRIPKLSGRTTNSTKTLVKYIRTTRIILKRGVRGITQGVENIQHSILQSLKAVRALFKVLLPICWSACLVLPFPAFPIPSKLAILAAITAPLLRESIIRNQKAIHSFIRDSGLFAAIMDTAVLLALPGLAIKHPGAMVDLFRIGAHRTRIQYGQDAPSQVLDLYLPPSSACRKLRGLVFFVVSKRGQVFLVQSNTQESFACCHSLVAWWSLGKWEPRYV